MEIILLYIVAGLFYTSATIGLLGCFYGLYLTFTGAYNDPNDVGPL